MTKHISFFLLLLVAVGSKAQTKRNINQESANKRMVLVFYQKLFGDKDIAVIDKYVAENYIQHNPQIADGRIALKNAVSQWFKGAPKEKVNIPQAAAEGDLVFLHVKTRSPAGKMRGIVEIFRIEKKQIVEHWDVIQDAPDYAKNRHPLF